MLRKMRADQYNVTIVSPRNYFLFTPLLPSTTTGFINIQAIIKHIRDYCRRANASNAMYVPLWASLRLRPSFSVAFVVYGSRSLAQDENTRLNLPALLHERKTQNQHQHPRNAAICAVCTRPSAMRSTRTGTSSSARAPVATTSRRCVLFGGTPSCRTTLYQCK